MTIKAVGEIFIIFVLTASGFAQQMLPEPWKEYLSFKTHDLNHQKTENLIDSLLHHPENPSNRVVARKIVKDAYDSDTYRAVYYYDLARIAHYAHEYRDAENYFEKYLDQFKNVLNSKGNSIESLAQWESVGNFYYEIQKYPEALKCYKKALRYLPDDYSLAAKINLKKRIDELQANAKK